jgi:hypothetical protein
MKKPTDALFPTEFVKGRLKSNFVPKSSSDGARKVSEIRLQVAQVDNLIDPEVNVVLVSFPFFGFFFTIKAGRHSEK